MSQTTEIVWVAKGGNNDRCYHVDESCMNCPDSHRQIELAKIVPTYSPCGRCTDADGNNLLRPHFECVECGNQKQGHTTGCRALLACPECGEMTTHEQT